MCGHDMQSCGFSEGLQNRRNFFKSFDDIIADAAQVRRWAKTLIEPSHLTLPSRPTQQPRCHPFACI